MRTFARLVGLLYPVRWWALLGVLLSLATLLANFALLALSSWFIASMAVSGATGVFLNYTIPAAGVRALALARATGRYTERLVNHDTSLRILAGLRSWFFRRIEPLAPAVLSAHRSGDLFSRIRADVDTLDDFWVRGVVPCLVALLGTAATTAFLARYDLTIALLVLAALLITGLGLPLLVRRLARDPGRRRITGAAQLRAGVVEMTQAMAELTALGALEEHARVLVEHSDRQERVVGRLAGLQGLGEAGLTAGSGLAVWATAIAALPLAAAGAIGRADFALLLVAALACFESILPVPLAIQRAGELAAAARRLFDLADAPPAVAEPAATAPAAAAAAAPTPATPHLTVRGLRFRYAPDLPWIIDGLSLDLRPGARLGITGPTGAGKSSLVSVLLRFWEYEGGSIRIGGVELRDLPGDVARSCFTVAPQAPHLFHETIRHNLLVASPLASDGELRAALAAVRLDESLDTIVGETGRALSAGEARRLSVARLLLRRAPIALLDEPTEGLDDDTAHGLLESVSRELTGVTLVVISHRERDLRLTDQRLTLDRL